jgi:hypothetical protein
LLGCFVENNVGFIEMSNFTLKMEYVITVISQCNLKHWKADFLNTINYNSSLYFIKFIVDEEHPVQK